MTDMVTKDLEVTLRRLRLGPLMTTLPERLALARQHKMPHQDFLLQILQDEVSRRDQLAGARRAERACLDSQQTFEAWDATAGVTYDHALLNELASLRFVESRQHVALHGPTGVGKTFLANALGNAACRRGYSVHLGRFDKILKSLKHARLDNTYDAELCRLVAVDLLVLDDFALDALDVTESRDCYEILVERHRAGSVIVTSNRDPSEWQAVFADLARGQAAIDRFTKNAYDLVIEGESYRDRQKPRLGAAHGGGASEPAPARPPARRAPRGPA